MNLVSKLFKDGSSFGTDTIMETAINDAAPMILLSFAGLRPLVHNPRQKKTLVFLKGPKLIFDDTDAARGTLPVTVMLPGRRCRRAIPL